MFEFLRKPKHTPAEVPVRKPVFIIGCGRSGTTLLFDLMKTHPQLVPTTGHPDGEDHVGWIEHGGAVIAGLANPRDDTGHVGFHFCLHMDENDVREDERRSMHRYYSTEVLNGRLDARIVNKCPHMSNKLRYVRSIFPDARFVHIIREPVAVVASWVNVLKAVPELLIYWPETEYPCFWVMEAGDVRERGASLSRESRLYPGGGLLRLADYWAEVNANIPRQLADAPEQLLTLHYEDLIADPAQTLRHITDFCDLDPFATVGVDIEPDRNSLRRPLLTEADVAGIRERTRATAEQFGYVKSS